MFADLKYLDDLKPVARAKEVYRLKLLHDPNYSEKKERALLFNKLRVQKHRLEVTMRIIEDFCEKDSAKLNAFETLLKSKKKLSTETDPNEQGTTLTIAVVRPTVAVQPKPREHAVGPSAPDNEADKTAAMEQVQIDCRVRKQFVLLPVIDHRLYTNTKKSPTKFMPLHESIICAQVTSAATGAEESAAADTQEVDVSENLQQEEREYDELLDGEEDEFDVQGAIARAITAKAKFLLPRFVHCVILS